jgi:GNAT superfamily N-acetyltransferase
MERPAIHAFGPAFAEAAARLLAEARRERWQAFPMLPAGLDDPATAVRLLDQPGTVALGEDGALRGILLAERREDPLWGPALVSGPDGWALAPGTDGRVLARLYAALPGRAPAHRVHVSAADAPGLDAWFHLGFGIEQAYAVARLDDLAAEAPAAPGVTVRRAAPGDEELLESLSHLIALQQAGVPVWAGAPARYLAELREGFRGLATDPEARVFLAFREGRALGYQAWFPMAPHPVDGAYPHGVELSVGATVPEARGCGVGRLLTPRGAAEAWAEGHRWCYTDWRTANPFAAAFWPARGFRPFLYRLTRRLDPLALEP